MDLTQGAVVNAADEFAEAIGASQAESGDDREVFLLRLRARGQDAPHAGGIDGHRFFGEDVQPGRDGRLQVHRTEMRRRGQEHHVHAAGNQLLIGVEADELPLGGHGNFPADFFALSAGLPGYF